MRKVTVLNRRDILRCAGAASAAAVFPVRLAWPAPPPGEIMTTMSAYMSEAASRKLPDAVVEKTKQAILDTLAAMISGSELPPGRFAIQFARAYKGGGVATVAGSNVVCGPIEAALANGILAHSDETDDTHPFSQSHPGCSVFLPRLPPERNSGLTARDFSAR